MNKEINIYCDGACLGNPGTGGWAALLKTELNGKKYEKLIVGSELNSTNNKMELKAAIEGLILLKKKCKINIYSDSKYLIHGITKWFFNWEKKNFKTSKNKKIKNKILWIKLKKITNNHDINWIWVKGHSGHIENEKVDQAARDEARKLQNINLNRADKE